MTDDRNNGLTTGRDRAGRFTKGNAGRPKGARHRATVAAEALLDGAAERITAKAIALALEGDVTALRLCLERIIPTRRERTTPIELDADADPAAAMGAIIGALAVGDLTPSEALKMTELVCRWRDAGAGAAAGGHFEITFVDSAGAVLEPPFEDYRRTRIDP